MTKENGLAWSRLDVDDESGSAQDIRNATTSLEFATPRAVQEVAGLDQSAQARLHLLADASLNAQGVFDDAVSDSPHDCFADLSAERDVGITVSAQLLDMKMLFTDYGLNRGSDGSLLWTAPAVLSDGTVPNWTV